MSLNWSISKCRDWEELNSDENWSMTESVIWMTMSVDLCGITEDNVDEFIWRTAVTQELNGSFLVAGGGGRVYVGPDDIRRRIGLGVNVSDMSRTDWIRKQFRIENNLAYEAEIDDAEAMAFVLDRLVKPIIERQVEQTKASLKQAKKRAKKKKQEVSA
jgi:hypothetical protein